MQAVADGKAKRFKSLTVCRKFIEPVLISSLFLDAEPSTLRRQLHNCNYMKTDTTLLTTNSETSQARSRPLARPLGRNLTLANISCWSWFVCDFAIAYACAALAFALTPHSIEIRNELVVGEHVGQMAFCLGIGLVLALIAHIAGLHEPNQRRTSLKLLGRCAVVSLSALLILNIEMLLVHYMMVGRLITFITFVGCTVGLFVVRALVVGLVVRNQYVVGFVGSAKFTAHAAEFDQQKSHGLRAVTLTLSEGESIDLRKWADENDVSQVVVDPDDELVPSQAELLGLINVNMAVSTYSNFVEKLYQRIPNDHINAQWVIECQEDHTVFYNSAIKRALDIVVASIALVLLLPVFAAAAIAVRLDSRGPIIFRQTRVGQFGEHFTMFKLRTMVEHAEQGGAQWASESDNRVTPVGQFLRRSRIDEIPQLINVLNGQMSLVGPRPERPEFTRTLETRIPFFVHRVLVKPGITGWAQINAGYAATEAEASTKLSFDLYYVKNLSFAMDVRVLLRTISSFASGSR